MDGELLRAVYHELFHTGKARRPRRCEFADAVILFIYFLAVASDRSPRWAHDRRRWPLWARRLPRPSYSQLMRRLKTPSIKSYIVELNATLRARLPRTPNKVVDGKPLVVGPYSKDPDARWGRLASPAWAKGYKMHVLADSSGGIDAFAVTPLNVGEATVARALVRFLDLNGAIVRADANYDSNALYRSVARRNGRLVAPRRKPYRGLGGHPQHADRLQAIELLERTPGELGDHKRQRIRVEQLLAHLTNLPFGVAPLPNWVRRIRRVRTWIAVKICLYHLHLALTLRIEKSRLMRNIELGQDKCTVRLGDVRFGSPIELLDPRLGLVRGRYLGLRGVGARRKILVKFPKQGDRLVPDNRYRGVLPNPDYPENTVRVLKAEYA